MTRELQGQGVESTLRWTLIGQWGVVYGHSAAQGSASFTPRKILTIAKKINGSNYRNFKGI
jgi:hypothetical protein